jgi:spore coat protein U-like protein
MGVKNFAVIRGIFAGAILMMLSTMLRAETQKSFTVSAVIANGCSIATNGGGRWGDIALGTVGGLASGTVQANLLNGAATGMQIDCTPGTSVNVAADAGDHAIAGVRQLAHATVGTSLISYQLFANGSATPWTTQTVPLSFPIGTSHLALPVTAKATLAAPMRGGAYSDTVRVTVTW